jgi:hypothetical protein
MLPNQHIKKTAALALTFGAIAPAAAFAKPIGPDPNSFTATPAPATQIVRVTTPSSGFDWGDAGIGAAGGLALALFGVGGALAISSQRRTRRPASPHAPTT